MSKQKIYIIHGWTYSLSKWRPLLKSLKQAGLEPIMLKVPGLTAKSDQVWEIAGYMVWLDQQLAGEDKPIVLGHSNGGRLALNYCIFKPNKLARLILLSSAGVPERSNWLKLKRTTFKALSKALKPLKRFDWLTKLVYRLAGASDYRLAPPNMRLTLHNLLSSDRQLQLEKIKTPTAIIWGAQDKLTPLWQAEHLKQTLNKVIAYQVIPRASHTPYTTHPVQLARLITKLVKPKR